MGRASRDKGLRAEREIVDRHKAIGIDSERVPLSGAQGSFLGDVDIYPWGREWPPLVCEVKARGDGAGFALIERWLSDADALFLRRDRAEPLVVLPWETYARLLKHSPHKWSGK